MRRKNLAVEVGLLDGVHVRDMHDARLAAPHSHHRPVLQHLAPDIVFKKYQVDGFEVE